ncbi:UPF0481 protein At3g47200-like [Eucalyptus grandis]|uniref:UPF0481 protein At3g47200-like n=1 Tax=Eucalyptus grandis TaxID=71139 RepID=UPI00192E7AF1|nr:UPF0481 protein At3g47200-like [Eucalyptus grandis]
MIMLENQIPLFILDWLLGLQLGDPKQMGRVAKLAVQFFDPPRFCDALMLMLSLFGKDDCEILKDNSERLKFDPLCDHGKEAGIEIRLRDDSSSWGDIRFKNGILRIPPLKIHKGTRSLFLNLIAFEESHFDCGNYITSYVIFMHNLINSPEDVRYLRNLDCGIIEHCLESDAKVANLFCRLCQEVALNQKDSYLWDISIELRAYYFGIFNLNSMVPLRSHAMLGQGSVSCSCGVS